MATALRYVLIQANVKQRYLEGGLRHFSTSQWTLSGHSRWSKIKHDKGKADGRKGKLRTALSKELTYASRTFGSDSNHPRLELAIANAKKADFPKSSIENAIARGQGVSSEGVALESVVIEAVLPPSVPFVIECQTDNQNRTVKDLRHVIKSHYGVAKSTLYCFEKRGRIRFEKDERGADDIFDEAVEAGAEDVDEEEDGGIVIYTDPAATSATATAFTNSTGLQVRSTELIFQGKSEMEIQIGSKEEIKALTDFVVAIQQDPAVQSIYANVGMSNVENEGLYLELESNLSN